MSDGAASDQGHTGPPWIVGISFVVAFVLAFGIGANDVANSVCCQKQREKRSLMRRATVCDDGGLEDPDAVPSMHVCHLCRVLWCRATGRRSRADHPNGIQMMCLVRSIVGSRAEHRPRRFVQRRPRRADAGDVDDSRKHSSMAAHRDIPEAARVGDARDRRWHHRFHACRKGNSCGYTVTTRSHHYRAHRVSIGGRWAGYRSRGSCRPCWLAS